MIWLYTGTPGSGKSLHMAKDIFFKLQVKKQNVLGNFDINEDVFKNKKRGNFLFVPNNELTVNYLYKYAKENNQLGKEGTSLLCIDECQTMFNPREFSRADRLIWINFFSQHRKLGFNVILSTQKDRLLDRQIRSMCEYEVVHRKVNNFKLGKIIPVPCFAAINYWYGNREKLDTEFFFYQKKLGKLYDSYKIFDNAIFKEFDKTKKNTVAMRIARNGGDPVPQGGTPSEQDA